MEKLFGTDGIRGKAFVEPLDEKTLRRLGSALALVLQRRTPQPHILLAGDTRASTDALAGWLGGAFMTAGGKVTWGNVLPTPAVSHILRGGAYQAGVVISASHNPAEDNGIKVLGRGGEKLNDGDEALLENEIPSAPLFECSVLPPVDASLIGMYEDTICTSHQTRHPLAGLKIVVDSANGAGSGTATRVITRLGADVIEIFASPDGANINAGCGATSPQALAERVIAESADAGLALDGDGDRGVLIDEKGGILDGDDILLAWARALKAQGKLPGGRVVATVMSNFGLEQALKENSMHIIRCPVGDRAVWATMRSSDAWLGGEQSGHIICSHHGVSGDGLLTGTHLIAIAAASGKRISELSNIVRLPQVLVNVPVTHKEPFSSLKNVVSKLADTENRLKGRGRVLLRYSGTEALARVMVEGDDQTEIETMASSLAEVISEELR